MPKDPKSKSRLPEHLRRIATTERPIKINLENKMLWLPRNCPWPLDLFAGLLDDGYYLLPPNGFCMGNAKNTLRKKMYYFRILSKLWATTKTHTTQEHFFLDTLQCNHIIPQSYQLLSRHALKKLRLT